MPSNKINDLFNVAGMIAVVTGGGSGLGLYAARALDANGAKAVYIVGRREKVLKEAAKTGVNGNIIPVVGDVTDKSSLKAIADRIREEQGYVNFLFANAGVVGPKPRDSIPSMAQGKIPSIQEYQEVWSVEGKFLVTNVHRLGRCYTIRDYVQRPCEEGMLTLRQPEMQDFSNTAHVNVTGVYYTAVAFLDLLAKANENRNLPQDSQILVTSSVAGYSRHLASSFAYSTSKAAVNHLVKMLATSFAQNGFHIRCNAINPGLYPSEMTANTVSSLDKFIPPNGHSDEYSDAHKMPSDRSPAERTGSEQDIAGTVLFMASKAGAYLNGETLITDGGRMSQLPASY